MLDAMLPRPRALALPLLCALLAACPPRRVDFGKDGEARSPEELLKRVELAEATVVGVKGDAKLVVESPQGKGSVALFVGVLHPAYLHIEQLDFFNRPQGVLTTDGERFGLFDSQHGKFYRGPATAPNLARFLPIVLPPKELAGLLLGRVPRIPAESTEMRFDQPTGLYVLVLRRGEISQTLEISPPSYRVVKSTVVGLQAYDVEFSDVRIYGAVSLPKRASLHAPKAQTRAELTWKDITINDSADLTLYDMAPPENVPVVEVDELGAPRAPAAP